VPGGLSDTLRARRDAWMAAGKPTRHWQQFKGSGSGGTASSGAVEVPITSAADSNLADLPEGRVAHWSREDLAIFSSAGLAVIIGLTTFAGSRLRLPELAASPQEATAIAGPLTRIVARRVKVPAAIRGDAADGMALASALSAYILRVYAAMSERAREDRERRSNAVFNPAAVPPPPPAPNPGPTPNGGAQPFDATQFFPPANRATGAA
jgi:hypothetical protein